MVTRDYFGTVYRYYEESDLAECRACHVRPEYRANGTNGAGHVICPKCGIRTGTSTSGLERSKQVANLAAQVIANQNAAFQLVKYQVSGGVPMEHVAGLMPAPIGGER